MPTGWTDFIYGRIHSIKAEKQSPRKKNGMRKEVPDQLFCLYMENCVPTFKALSMGLQNNGEISKYMV